MSGKQKPLQQFDEFFCCHPRLAKDGAECPAIERFMVRNYNLCIRLVTPKNDMTSVLTLELKSLFQKCGDALAP